MSRDAATATPDQTLAAAYLDGFTEVMHRTPTRRSHTNVLQHLAGYVSDQHSALSTASMPAWR